MESPGQVANVRQIGERTAPGISGETTAAQLQAPRFHRGKRAGKQVVVEDQLIQAKQIRELRRNVAAQCSFRATESSQGVQAAKLTGEETRKRFAPPQSQIFQLRKLAYLAGEDARERVIVHHQHPQLCEASQCR